MSKITLARITRGYRRVIDNLRDRYCGRDAVLLRGRYAGRTGVIEDVTIDSNSGRVLFLIHPYRLRGEGCATLWDEADARTYWARHQFRLPGDA